MTPTRIIHHPPDPILVDRLAVELLRAGFAHVTDNGDTRCVCDYYCAHCRDKNDGENICIHKLAVAQAQAQEERSLT